MILHYVSVARPGSPVSAAHVLCTTGDRGWDLAFLQKTLNEYNLIFHEVMQAANEAAVSSPGPNADACLTRSVDQTDAASPDRQPGEDRKDGNPEAGGASNPAVQNPANAEAHRQGKALCRVDTIGELMRLHKQVKDLKQ